MKVIFMGTPDFAVNTLEALIAAGHDVVLAVTQPDKPKGRGKTLQFPPVKEAARTHGIEVFQPGRIRDPECVGFLRSFQADIIVVAAFGQILPQEILNMPPYGCVNVHASLLPKYRGAAPIQWAVINGDRISGVTTMRMDEGLDTGDMIMKEEVILDPKETGGSLFDKLSRIGADLCVKTLAAIGDGSAVYTPQDHEAATKVGMIRKEFGRMDWSTPARQLERLIRGLSPWPGTYTKWNDKILKIWDADVIERNTDCVPGCVVKVTGDDLRVQTGDGILALKEVQPEGKKRMPCGAFLRGNHVREGERFL